MLLMRSEVSGTTSAPIVIAGTAGQKPVFEGGASGLQLSRCSFIELRDLAFTGARGNGINIDDGGQHGAPVKGIVLRGLDISNVGPRGNCDGIKLSGVDSFAVAGCKLENWGDGGSGIDMVGCHEGTISRKKAEALEQIRDETLAYLQEREPTLQISWQDLMEACGEGADAILGPSI